MRSNLAPSAFESASEARTSVAFSKFAPSRLLFRKSVEVKSAPVRFAPLRSLPLRMISFLSHSVQSTPAAAFAEQLALASAAPAEKSERAANTAAKPNPRTAGFKFLTAKSIKIPFQTFHPLAGGHYQLASAASSHLIVDAESHASQNWSSQMLSLRKPAAETA